MSGNEIVPAGGTDNGGIEVWTAATVVGQIVKTAALVGMLIPPSWKGIIGRHAKALLEDGFPGEMVLAACWMGCMRGRPEVAQYIAGDLMLASTGNRMSTREYETKLRLYEATTTSACNLLADQREKRAAIEQRRSA
jgi:hypothetical protein